MRKLPEYKLSSAIISINCNKKFDDFNWSQRHYSSKQFRLFAYVADCIISHNIWIADENSLEAYMKFGLESLLPEYFEKIKKDNPLLYILSLADTIDSYKVFSKSDIGLQMKDISKYVDIQEIQERKGISIKTNNGLDINCLWDNVKDLAKWVEVETKFVDQSIFIYF